MSKLALTLSVVDNLVLRIRGVFSSIGGIALSCMGFMFSTFGAKAELIHYVLIFILLDLVFGIASAIKMKKFGWSQCLVRTAIKIAVYLCLYFCVMMIETGLSDSWYIGSKAAFGILCSAEMLSILSHVAILFPNMLGVKLFKKLLSVEVSKKLDISKEELENILKDEKSN